MANTSPNMTNLLADLMELGGYVGFDQAANALKHYREGTGTDLNMPESWLRSYEDIQQAEKANQEKIQSKIVSNANNRTRLSALRDGESITLKEENTYKEIKGAGINDLHFASGKSNLKTEGTLTFTRQDNILSVTGAFANRWYDRYDWEKGTSFFGGMVTGEDMQQLDNAKPFDMIGQWSVKVQGKVPINAVDKLSVLNLNQKASTVSPKVSTTPAKNQAQLAMNAKVLKARRASLLEGRAVRAGASAAPAAPATSATRAGAQRLYEQKAASLHPDPVAARRAVRTTLPEQFSLPDFSNLFNNAVDGLQSVLGVKTAAAKEVTATRGQLESAKIAGLVMDQPMADKVMTSKAYQTKTDPLNGFATTATQSFYGAAYADDNPSAPKRRSALEEPGRKAQVESLEQKQARETQARYAAVYAEIDRENRQRDKDEAAQNKQREAAAASEAKRVRETAAMEEVGATPGALPTETVQVAKVDRLGDNAVSAAQAAQGGRQAGMLSTVNASQEVRANAASLEAETKAVAARRAINSNERTQGASARAMSEEALYGNNPTPGSLGTAGKRDASGKYISGTNSRGMSTGGVELDVQGREIGAYGQFTRDIMGRTGSDASSNTRVICTELVRQGRMAPSLQRLDIAFTLRKLSPATVRGYHFWAVPYVRLMRRSELATTLIEPIATWRALEIAYLLGERDRPHWRGKLVRVVMEPLCWLLGWMIEVLPGDADRFYPGRVAGGQSKTPTP